MFGLTFWRITFKNRSFKKMSFRGRSFIIMIFVQFECVKSKFKKIIFFRQNKVKLFLVVDMKAIVRFFFKMSFSKIKNNFNNTSSKRPSRVPKRLLKMTFIYPNILVNVHLHSYGKKRPFGLPKSITKHMMFFM